MKKENENDGKWKHQKDEKKKFIVNVKYIIIIIIIYDAKPRSIRI